MYHVVYKTVNTVNGKIYVGVHSTKNINDGYLGSNLLLQYDIHAFGKEKFLKEIIQVCDDRASALKLEGEIVDQSFVDDPNTYNIRCGNNKNSRQINEKIAKYRTGKALSEETKSKIAKSQTGKKHSEETKKKLALAWERRKAKI